MNSPETISQTEAEISPEEKIKALEEENRTLKEKQGDLESRLAGVEKDLVQLFNYRKEDREQFLFDRKCLQDRGLLNLPPDPKSKNKGYRR